MKITQTREGSRLTVALEGKLDATTSYEFDQELMSSLSGVTELILDLEKLESISSAGLRVLLAAQKAMNNQGKMELIHVGGSIMMILEVTGFSRMLAIRE